MLSVVALTGLLAFGVDTGVASAASTGSISGTVTGPSSVVEPNVCVTAYGYSTGVTATATTDNSGDYTISNLPADSYQVEFDPSCNGTISSTLAIQWYQYEPDVGHAAYVAVGASNSAGISALLQTASTISGTVTNTSSADVQGVCVYLFTVDGSDEYEYTIPNTVTAANGTYTISNLQNDTYEVQFDPTCTGTITNSPYAMQYYNDEPDLGTA